MMVGKDGEIRSSVGKTEEQLIKINSDFIHFHTSINDVLVDTTVFLPDHKTTANFNHNK